VRCDAEHQRGLPPRQIGRRTEQLIDRLILQLTCIAINAIRHRMNEAGDLRGTLIQLLGRLAGRAGKMTDQLRAAPDLTVKQFLSLAGHGRSSVRGGLLRAAGGVLRDAGGRGEGIRCGLADRLCHSAAI
jgi:hypothetical protein